MIKNVLPIRMSIGWYAENMCFIQSSWRLTHNDEIAELIHRTVVAEKIENIK